MKKSIIAFIFLATLFLSACQKNGNDLPQTSYNEEIDLTDNVEKDAEVSFAEEQKNQFETISGINNDVLKIISISDADFEYYVKDSIVISDEEIIDRTEWIEENKCYLVSIARTQDVEGEYKHLRDYIFVRDTSFKCIEVSYPSKFDSIDSDRYVFDACDFEVEYKDVTFDGNKDLVISLGHQGSAGSLISCAYVYEDGEYRYVKSFEHIPNYYINYDLGKIQSYVSLNSVDLEYSEFFYDGNEFVLDSSYIYNKTDSETLKSLVH